MLICANSRLKTRQNQKGSRDIIVTRYRPDLSRSGFTVLELIVAIGIAVVVLGIAVPSLMQWLPTLRLSSGTRQVATDLQVTRMKAISQNTKFRMSFVGAIPGATSYQIQKYDDASASYVLESGPFTLPDGISVSAQSATPEFQPRGTATSASTITLQNTNSDTKSIQVAIVGRVLTP